jgi:hypothetical protein
MAAHCIKLAPRPPSVGQVKCARTGLLVSDEEWNRRIREERDKGREISCFSHPVADKVKLQAYLKQWKLRLVNIGAMI